MHAIRTIASCFLTFIYASILADLAGIAAIAVLAIARVPYGHAFGVASLVWLITLFAAATPARAGK